MSKWEVEIKVRRNGRMWRWEKAIGETPMCAYESATTNLVRDLQDTDDDDANMRWTGSHVG